MGKGKRRISRIAFCEWNSESWWKYNVGSIICENCNFHRSLRCSENHGSNYQLNNKVEREETCPNCKTNEHWYYMPSIARIPRKAASRRIWKKFWNDLKGRRFNHPSSCR
jgi:hypothetical protein